MGSQKPQRPERPGPPIDPETLKTRILFVRALTPQSLCAVFSYKTNTFYEGVVTRASVTQGVVEVRVNGQSLVPFRPDGFEYGKHPGRGRCIMPLASKAQGAYLNRKTVFSALMRELGEDGFLYATADEMNALIRAIRKTKKAKTELDRLTLEDFKNAKVLEEGVKPTPQRASVKDAPHLKLQPPSMGESARRKRFGNAPEGGAK